MLRTLTRCTKKQRRRKPQMRATLLKAFALLLAFAAPAAAQDYPSKPLRLIIPFAPGGSVDIVARLAAQKLGDRLGKQVVAENRAGAGGMIGLELANAAPAGRPYARAGLAGACGQSAHPQAQLRHREDAHIRRLARQRPERVHGASLRAGNHREGADRARQGKARHAAFRARRRRQLYAYRVGAVLHDGRHRHGDGAVQGRRPGDDRRAWAATASS